jgi:cyclic-di-GMP-binding protein
MPTFDIVSKVDIQTLDNAINNAKKEIINRYDFSGSNTSIELDKKALNIVVSTEDEMRMKSIQDVLITRVLKQQIDSKVLDFSKENYPSGSMLKKDIKVKQGIEKELAKKIVKEIKDSKLKVEASIMDDQVRVSAKKIDDLQSVISLLRGKSYDQPLQFINMRS